MPFSGIPNSPAAATRAPTGMLPPRRVEISSSARLRGEGGVTGKTLPIWTTECNLGNVGVVLRRRGRGPQEEQRALVAPVGELAVLLEAELEAKHHAPRPDAAARL